MVYSDEQLLSMSIAEILTLGLCKEAIAARDRKSAKIEEVNAEYKRKNSIGIITISDDVSPFLNHADGKMYDSKTKYYAALKATGNHVMESGESYKPADPIDTKQYREQLNKEIYHNIQSITSRRK